MTVAGHFCSDLLVCRVEQLDPRLIEIASYWSHLMAFRLLGLEDVREGLCGYFRNKILIISTDAASADDVLFGYTWLLFGLI